jgi:hypothetical protein
MAGVIVLTLGSGCTAQGPFYADKGFTETQKALVEKAAAEWERATGGLESVDIVWEADPAVYHPRMLKRRAGPPAVYQGEGDAKPIRHYGVTSDRWLMNGETVNVLLWPDTLTDNLVYRTALHEFGHVLMGLEHSTQKGTVMYPVIEDTADCLTAADLARYCAHRGCEAASMVPCSPGGEDDANGITGVGVLSINAYNGAAPTETTAASVPAE